MILTPKSRVNITPSELGARLCARSTAHCSTVTPNETGVEPHRNLWCGPVRMASIQSWETLKSQKDFFTLSPNNIYGEVEKILLFSNDSFAVHSSKSRSEGLQQPGRTVQKPKLLCLYYLLSDFNYTDEATVLNRTIPHPAWVFAIGVALSVPWWWSSRGWLRLPVLCKDSNIIMEGERVVVVVLQVLVGGIIQLLLWLSWLCENKQQLVTMRMPHQRTMFLSPESAFINCQIPHPVNIWKK